MDETIKITQMESKTEKSINQKILDKILERDKRYWERKAENFIKTGNYYK